MQVDIIELPLKQHATQKTKKKRRRKRRTLITGELRTWQVNHLRTTWLIHTTKIIHKHLIQSNYIILSTPRLSHGKNASICFIPCWWLRKTMEVKIEANNRNKCSLYICTSSHNAPLLSDSADNSFQKACTMPTHHWCFSCKSERVKSPWTFFHASICSSVVLSTSIYNSITTKVLFRKPAQWPTHYQFFSSKSKTTLNFFFMQAFAAQSPSTLQYIILLQAKY